MRAQDIMTTAVVTATSETSVTEIAELLLKNRISAVPIVDDGKLVGIVSEGDLMRRQEIGTAREHSWWLSLISDDGRAEDYVKSHGTKAANVMTRDLVTVDADATLADVATTLERHRIKRVPVMKDGKLAGIVSRANLLHGLMAQPAAKEVTSDDRDIRAKLLAAFDEAGVRTHLMNLVVHDGTVRLYGTVRSQTEIDAVQVAIDGIPGIKEAVNELSVMPDSAFIGY